MIVLGPKEFIETAKTTDLTAYIDYLTEVQKEAEIALNDAINEGLDEKIVGEITAKLNEILSLIDVCERNLKRTILKSIGELSVEELKTYFDSNVALTESKIAAAEQKLAELQNRLKELDAEIKGGEKLDEELEEFFSSESASLFFKYENEQAFLEDLLMGDLDTEKSEKLRRDILYILKQYAQGIDSELDTESMLKASGHPSLVADIMQLLNNKRRILRFSPSAKDSIMKNLLQSPELTPTMTVSFDSSIKIEFLKELFVLSKTKYAFYEGLDKETKIALTDEGFTGPTNEDLKSKFETVKSGGHLPSTVAPVTIDEYDECQKACDRKERELAHLKESQFKLEYFLSDADAMREALTKRLNRFIESEVSFDELVETIEKTEEAYESVKERMQNISKDIAHRNSLIADAKAMLSSPNYEGLFNTVLKRNQVKVFKDCGIDISSNAFKPLLESEQRRLAQIDWFISLQQALETKQGEIETLKASVNFFSKHAPSYKEKLARLEREYEEIFNSKILEGNEKGLLQVQTPSQTSGFQNTPAQNTIFNSFDGTFTCEQSFWDFKTLLEADKVDDIAKAFQYEDWQNLSESLRTLQMSLMRRLFTYTKDGKFYSFAISSIEREQLREVQEEILAIIQDLIYEQDIYYTDLTLTSNSYESSLFDEERTKLRELGILEETPQAVQKFIEDRQEEVQTLEIDLIRHRAWCEKFQIPVSENDHTAGFQDKSTDLDGMIKALQIPGVNTLEEAQSYRRMIEDLTAFTLPKDVTKRLYLEAVKRK